MADATTEPEIVDDPDQTRYEIRLDGEVVGVADYVRQQGLISFTHTEVDRDRSGQGLAGKLIAFALDAARDAELEVLPFCSFVNDYIGKHREYLGLVPADRRAEFGLPAESS
jgi:predicted GNAT family acetyltransferase